MHLPKEESYRIQNDHLDTRGRIIESAILEFAKYGYNGTSTARIAARATISEAMVFKIFKSKKELLHSVLLEIIQVKVPRIATEGLEDLQPFLLGELKIDDVKGLIRSKVDLILSELPSIKVLLLELNYHEDIQSIYTKEFVPMMLSKVGQLLDVLKIKGILREDLDNRTTARSIMGMMAIMLLDYNLISRGKMDLEEEMNKVFDLILKGIAKEGTI